MAKEEIRWSAQEFTYYEKDIRWFWISGIVALALVVIAIWQNNFLFAVFVTIAEMMIVFYGRRAPRELDFSLSKKGLHIEGVKFYPHERLAGFAVVDNEHDPLNPNIRELILQTKTLTEGYLKITIASEDEEPIRDLLNQFLPEINYKASLSDFIGRLIRF